MDTQRERDDKTISSLNSLLRGEISAVETYRHALEKVKDDRVCERLRDSQESHQGRVNALKEAITRRGGRPSDSAGVWGGFARLVEGGAALVGEKAAIDALEAGEDHGMSEYREELEKVDPEAQQLLRDNLLPEQERTHSFMSELKKSLH